MQTNSANKKRPMLCRLIVHQFNSTSLSTQTPAVFNSTCALSMANNRVPINYQVPSFPSLYDPLPSPHRHAFYLYYTGDIWRFTLYWTLIFYAATHITVAGCAVLVHFRNWSIIWLVPLIYSITAGLTGLLAGSIIGLVCVFIAVQRIGWVGWLMINRLGALYEAGNFRMSTWLPLIWGGVNVMVLILTSFPMYGGL